ncbi:MAG: hypothetical protein ACP5MB_06845 [bacterium]
MPDDIQQKMYLLSELEKLSTRLGIRIRYEHLAEAKSGLCVIKGQSHLIIDLDSELEDKLKIFKDVLSGAELSNVFLPPVVRKFLSIE